MVVIVVVPVMLNTDPALVGVMVVVDAMLLPNETDCLMNAYAARKPSSASERASVPAGPLLAALVDRDSMVVGIAMLISLRHQQFRRL
jgi:hypothetical protein